MGITFNQMVEQTFELDSIFQSLADPIRRDILRRVAQCELSVNELAARYDVSLAAVSKHLKVLERARLVHKRREGKQYKVTAAAGALKEADAYLDQYRQMWQGRMDKLETLLNEEENNGRS